MSFHIISIDSPHTAKGDYFISNYRNLTYPPAMLTEYIQAAMRHAHYEIMENGRSGAISRRARAAGGDGDTLEECRENLRGALECWILVGVAHGDSLPVIDEIDLNSRVYAETDQMA